VQEKEAEEEKKNKKIKKTEGEVIELIN